MNVSLIRQMIVQFVVFSLAFAASLFLPAWSVMWPAAWVYLALFLSFYLGVQLWLLKHNPGLLQERMHLGTADQKGWDKLLFTLLMVIPFAWLAFISLDAARFHWSSVPLWLQLTGAAILLGSFGLLFLTFRENSYLSTVVRIQEDRGHAVVSSGPYHYVRHPMYAALLLFMIGTPLLLGSVYGALAGVLFALALARRAVLEENTLRDELAGYESYAQQVKYRMIPFVW